MRKHYGKYIVISLMYFAVIAFLNGWFDTKHLSVWIGLVLGALLPDVDSLLYAYATKPNDLSSQRIRKYIAEKNFSKAADLIYKTRTERTNLLFHSILFQLVFAVFAFYIVTSAGSFFGTGLVIAFFTHLVIDQYVEIKNGSTLSEWMSSLTISFTPKQAKYYTYSMMGLLVFLGLVV